jgi:hypothetical protein
MVNADDGAFVPVAGDELVGAREAGRITARRNE